MIRISQSFRECEIEKQWTDQRVTFSPKSFFSRLGDFSRCSRIADPKGIPQFGLVAEEVEKVDPDLVVQDKEGKPFTVRYDAVNAMLLNEFLNSTGSQSTCSSSTSGKLGPTLGAHQNRRLTKQR
jgi:hypothetical protein